MKATSRSWERRETNLVEACKQALVLIERLTYHYESNAADKKMNTDNVTNVKNLLKNLISLDNTRGV